METQVMTLSNGTAWVRFSMSSGAETNASVVLTDSAGRIAGERRARTARRMRLLRHWRWSVK